MVAAFGARCPGVRVAGSLAVLAALGSPGRADACFFYDPGPDETTYVDQTATRVLFKQTPAGTTAIFQLQYEGNARDFAWLVPVPALPEFAVEEGDPFGALDYATAPRFRYGTAPSAAATSESSGGCGGSSVMKSAEDSSEEYTRVAVWDSGQVGPFFHDTLTAEDAGDLVSWLEDNGYPVPAAAEELLQQYVDESWFFVAVKLAPDAVDETVIRPITLSWEGWEPIIPLRLSQLTATRDMGLIVYVLADRQAVPENWAQVAVADSQIQVDEITEEDNYDELVAAAVEGPGAGRAFVTEFARPASTLQGAIFDASIQELLAGVGYVTRLYTRVDPEDLTVDPTFVLGDGLADVSNLHDLTRGEYAAAPASRSTRFAGLGPLALLLFARTLRRRAAGRLERARLRRECAKLDPDEERALAEERLRADAGTWPEY